MTTTEPSTGHIRFLATDRCDRCGARARSHVVLLSGGELLFCAHHTRAHANALQTAASHISWAHE